MHNLISVVFGPPPSFITRAPYHYHVKKDPSPRNQNPPPRQRGHLFMCMRICPRKINLPPENRPPIMRPHHRPGLNSPRPCPGRSHRIAIQNISVAIPPALCHSSSDPLANERRCLPPPGAPRARRRGGKTETKNGPTSARCGLRAGSDQVPPISYDSSSSNRRATPSMQAERQMFVNELVPSLKAGNGRPGNRLVSS
jgi:hypothetical protein